MPVLMTTPTPSSHAAVPVVVTGAGRVQLSASLSAARPAERMRLRPWLIKNIQEKLIPGLEWLDEAEQLVKIPWKHAARHGWTCDKDASLFRAWAVHTKKYDPVSNTPRANPKIWKANFRCAINSLPDILEVKGQGKSKGNDAFKIYKLIPKRVNRKKNASIGKTVQKKSLHSKRSRVFKPSESHRAKSTCPLIFPKSQDRTSSGTTPTDQYINSLLQSRLPGYCMWDEPARNEISQPQRTPEPWGSSITYTNRQSPIGHELPLYPTPPSSSQGTTADPLNPSSGRGSSSSTTPVSSPPAYPYPRDALPPQYGARRQDHHLPSVRRSELMDYITEGSQREDASSDGYKELQDAESNGAPSDEEIIEIVDGMTRDSPLNSPTRTSPYDGNNNSNSSSYWHTSTLDDKHFFSDERMIPSTSDLSMRPPHYQGYQATSHALKVEGRPPCDYMKSEVYREQAGTRITQTSSGTCFFAL